MNEPNVDLRVKMYVLLQTLYSDLAESVFAWTFLWPRLMVFDFSRKHDD